jgi:hypothetical protein
MASSEPAWLCRRFTLALWMLAMRTKKPPRLISAAGLARLGTHATMGIAMGLVFALVVILINPSGIVLFAGDAASANDTVPLGALALTFAIGAALTGAILMMTEEDDC